MDVPRTSDTTLAEAMRILADEIESPDGVPEAAIREAGERIAELSAEVEKLRDAIRQMRDCKGRHNMEIACRNAYALIE